MAAVLVAIERLLEGPTPFRAALVVAVEEEPARWEA
jgi:hypothetical protein